MDTYQTIAQSVLNYLSDHQYCSSLIKANKRCFEKLRIYLEEKNLSYSPEAALEWYTQANDLAPSDINHGRVALERLRDVAETGSVRIEHETRHLMSYTVLSSYMKNRLEDYLDFKKDTFSEATIDNHRHSCAKFLAFAQKRGIQQISGISAALIADFYNDAIYFGIFNKSQVNSHVSAMMQYFYEKGEVSYSCTLIIHYLSHGKSQGCFWNEISNDAHLKIGKYMGSSETICIETLRSYKDILVQLHRKNGYSKNVTTLNNRAVDFLILFLEMNGYAYNPDIAMVWFEEIRPHFGKQAASYRRALCMIADYYHTSSISLEAVYRVTPSHFYQLPAWCFAAADGYVETKIKEGWAQSTLNMIRSSITRFCFFLDAEGIRSFGELNTSHIKKFHVYDTHKTPQGKNAYNARIRKFLIYLGEHGFLTNPMLFVSLPRTSAPKETIVVVLTEDEMAELTEQLNKDDSRLTLRKKAMLLLGLKMGLRASDVANLSVEDVNWASASIRFIQKKTSVEVNLPMPTEVGNALFRYIMEERGQKSSSKVFLSEKAPKKPVGRAVCSAALRTALPDRKVEGSGFHVTRKTYATRLLKNGVGSDMVAEALGQCGTSSVHRYLSLDTDRMRMCPLSLSECSVGGWSHER